MTNFHMSGQTGRKARKACRANRLSRFQERAKRPSLTKLTRGAEGTKRRRGGALTGPGGVDSVRPALKGVAAALLAMSVELTTGKRGAGD